MSTKRFPISREMRVSRKGSWPLDSCSMVKEICGSIEFNESWKEATADQLKLYNSISLSLSFDLPKTTSAMSSIKFHAHLARGATLAKLKDPLLLGERNI